ncbi:hypothetical protein [Puniceibacterium confluentis]|uniref:hypothetical protein n=1 Tax=Puniceibacterium confluentis TaxID=1958944 RepID=UPI0011B7C3CC|nr:hypothetical protein [Puniceibacterium confluentis]
MLRKTAFLSALAALGLAGSLQAEEHYVLLLGQGYFPDVVHPAVGDTIRFVNITDIPMAAIAEDGSWSTGELPENGEFILAVTDGMTQNYVSALPEPEAPATETTSAEPVTDPAAPPAPEPIIAAGVIDYVNPAPVELNSSGKPLMQADAAYDS